MATTNPAIRSLRRFNKPIMNPTGVGNGKSWNLHRFQDLVYSQCADIVFVNETWLTGRILNADLNSLTLDAS